MASFQNLIYIVTYNTSQFDKWHYKQLDSLMYLVSTMLGTQLWKNCLLAEKLYMSLLPSAVI